MVLLLGGVQQITTWQQFGRQVRAKDGPLLRRLGEFRDTVLVAGCQRSGTTMLTRVLNEAPELVDFRFGRDDELDAALILAGAVPHEVAGRHCFQTTYLNERYGEYAASLQEGADFRLIWVVRNPYSVVYSLLYNWRSFGLNELFRGCGAARLDGPARRRYDWLGGRLGHLAVRRLKRACLSYSGKAAQVFELAPALGERMLVVDYDALVADKMRLLPQVFAFAGLEYRAAYADGVHGSSVNKASRLSARERAMIHDLCSPVYERARALAVQ
ncbi:hypothetical protein HUS23_00735 [Ectothiorhodospiraceae bacterium 2226]|nr:hypothetical protein HUS23_00735 [Ectothiorhodospiraceae bacterium 2226]